MVNCLLLSNQVIIFLNWKIGTDAITAQTIWQYLEAKEAVAEWESIEYTITFDANGGTLEGAVNLSVEYEQTLTTLPEQPQRGLWVFEGWSSEDNTDVNRDENSVITQSETWYAVWHYIDTYTKPLLMSNYFYNIEEKNQQRN